MRAPFAALIFVPLLAVPWLTPSETGDLSGRYTDHLRHASAVRVFFARGPAINRVPFAESAKGLEGRALYWGHVPYTYPPGAHVLFLPFSAAPARLLVTFTTALAGLAWAAVLALLFAGTRSRKQLAVSAALALFSFLALARAGLEGFYDPAWVGLGALAILALEHRKHELAIALCLAALCIHLRAVALLPVLAAALAAHRRPGWLAATAVVGAIDLWVLVGAVPFTEALRGGMAPLSVQPVPLAASAILTAIAAAWCFQQRQLLAAACLGVVFASALGDNRAWWHASIALIPLLLAGARRAHPALTAFLLVWAVQLQRFAWGGRVWDLPMLLWKAVA